MDSKLASFLVGSFSLLFFSFPARAETVLETIQRTGVVKLAIREDAAPFGYLDSNQKLQGYCLDFFVILKEQLSRRLDRNTLIIRLLKSSATNRFQLVAQDLVNLECGPNTIRDTPPIGTQFSTNFFVSGTQFLIKAANSSALELDGDLEEVRIGVLGNTSTAEFLENRYPSATLVKFGGRKGRDRGVQALEQGRIAAMVSDGILLRAEAQLQNLSRQEYPLIPEPPLTCDRYGMIITSNDPEWQDFINFVIESPESQRLLNNWFGTFIADAEGSQSLCQIESE
ncbi:transporter substrate-binding domain-containing protein [Myxosarcina sp. GI1(2024)]